MRGGGVAGCNTCEANRQPSVFMLTRRAAVFAVMRPTCRAAEADQASPGEALWRSSIRTPSYCYRRATTQPTTGFDISDSES
jgi:hypothetical protein